MERNEKAKASAALEPFPLLLFLFPVVSVKLSKAPSEIEASRTPTTRGSAVGYMPQWAGVPLLSILLSW